jgi:hypothetical protein
MRRILATLFFAFLLVAAFVAGGRAAAKSYQFTGTVKAAAGDTVTVEKSAKETWEFDVPKDVKGGGAEGRRPRHRVLQDGGDADRIEAGGDRNEGVGEEEEVDVIAPAAR